MRVRVVRGRITLTEPWRVVCESFGVFPDRERVRARETESREQRAIGRMGREQKRQRYRGRHREIEWERLRRREKVVWKRWSEAEE